MPSKIKDWNSDPSLASCCSLALVNFTILVTLVEINMNRRYPVLFPYFLCHGPKDGATIRARINPQHIYQLVYLPTLSVSGFTTSHVLRLLDLSLAPSWSTTPFRTSGLLGSGSGSGSSSSRSRNSVGFVVLHSGRSWTCNGDERDRSCQLGGLFSCYAWGGGVLLLVVKTMGTLRSRIGNKKVWWCLSTLGGHLPSTLGGPARHIFVISLGFSSGWTSAPLKLACGAGRDGYCRTRCCVFRARDLYLVAPPPRETPTSHPRRPDVPLRPCQCVRCSFGWASAPLL